MFRTIDTMSIEDRLDEIAELKSFVECAERMSVNKALSGKVPIETLNKYSLSMAANGQLYKHAKGFLPSLMGRMYTDRTRYKKEMIEIKKDYEKTKNPNLIKEIARLDNMQMAKKIQLNSAYGALGNQWFRWFDVNNAEAITTSGQLAIRWIEIKLNEYLNKILKTTNEDYVIASDTDSVYITLATLIDKVFPKDTDDLKIVEFIDKTCKQKIEPYIDASYQELAVMMNAYAQKMQMKRENIASKGIWKAKKMYILNVWNSEGVQYTEPKLKILGIEAVKSSTPAACRSNIKKAISLIMNNNEQSLQAFVTNFRAEFMMMPFEDIAFPRGVNDIQKWYSFNNIKSGCPIHVRACIVHNKLIAKQNLENKYQTITNGEKIKFCYLKKPNPMMQHVIASLGALPPEFNLDAYIDYDTQFQKAFLDPVKSLTDTIGWMCEKFTGATLEDHFS